MNISPDVLRLLIIGLCISLVNFPSGVAAYPDQAQPVPAPTPLSFEPKMTTGMFAYGEKIPIELEIQNNGAIPANLSGIPPEVVVSLRKTGWDRGVMRTIPVGRNNSVLGPGSTYTMTVPWDQKDDRGIQVDPGIYYLTMNASGINAYYEIVILPPEGVLVGSISPPGVVTSNGITAQLESVVLHEDEGLITVRITRSKESSLQLQAPGLSGVTAGYGIDGRPPSGFRDIFEKDLKTGGYTITWKTAPVSCNAKELNLQVTKFDPYDGVWNFPINLSPVSQCIWANGTTSWSRGNEKQQTADIIQEPTTRTAAGFTGFLCLAAFAGAVILIMSGKKRK